MAEASIQSLQNMMDILNSQMSSLATTQDLHNERLTAAESHATTLQTATDTAMSELESKLNDATTRMDQSDAKIMSAEAQLEALKRMLEGMQDARAEARAEKDIRIMDDKAKLPNTFNGDRKKWKSWQRMLFKKCWR